MGFVGNVGVTPDAILFFLDLTVSMGVYNLNSTCGKNHHKGAYILRYGNNNMFTTSTTPKI
ncbi:hypothetical protein LL127_23700 (plasmid) [Clostridium estertheticum]|uniref:hypothetical protein n=1 Tax=Clostridium estertheticum TaxID=238834 RepID=UPI001CF4420C|nr:hypothetical protein [Clostridium estertheticum]MCB2309271.1 hypothetical protein [Clostridium estertheticum]MCB2346804.1 hypothetical protein [Clostridium estertheticum]WAG48543.1 hypothetical protein LL127_23700 [Clostridium estertheticum]